MNEEQVAKVVEEVIKHLPGRHHQKTHARNKGASSKKITGDDAQDVISQASNNEDAQVRKLGRMLSNLVKQGIPDITDFVKATNSYMEGDFADALTRLFKTGTNWQSEWTGSGLSQRGNRLLDFSERLESSLIESGAIKKFADGKPYVEKKTFGVITYKNTE